MRRKKPLLWIPIVDDRGQECQLVSFELAQQCGAYPAWPRRAIFWSSIVGGFGSLPLLFQGFSSSLGVGSKIWLAGAGLAILVFIVLSLIYGHTSGPRERPFRKPEAHHEIAARLGDRMLHRLHCPTCAYPLAGLAVAPDGCIQCPECGAAWKADRVSKPPRS